MDSFVFVEDQIGHVFVDSTLFYFESSCKLPSCHKAWNILNRHPKWENIPRRMLSKDLSLFGRYKIRGFLQCGLKKLAMLLSIHFGHQYLNILADDLVLPWEPKHLQHTHVALCDLPESLALPRYKHTRGAIGGIRTEVLHRAYLILVRVEVVESVAYPTYRHFFGL